MKLKQTFLILLFCFLINQIKAQVWYPEGFYKEPKIEILESDANHVIAVSKLFEDNLISNWVISIYNGRTWDRLPVLTLNKAAQIKDVKFYKGMFYVAGNFVFGNQNALLRLRDKTWESVGKFVDQDENFAQINDLEIYGNSLLMSGNFHKINSDIIPYLANFNLFNFSSFFNRCNRCSPNLPVSKITVQDSSLGVIGDFTQINGQKSNYIYFYKPKSFSDTFPDNLQKFNHISTSNDSLYVGTSTSILKCDGAKFIQLNYNINDIIEIKSFVFNQLKLVVSGVFKINGNTFTSRILELNSNTWQDLTLNFKECDLLTSTRTLLFGAGSNSSKMSAMQNSKFVVAKLNKERILLKIKVFNDQNNNCLNDNSENPLPKIIIKIEPLNRYLFTNLEGVSEAIIPKNMNLKFIVLKPRNLTSSSCSDTFLIKSFTSSEAYIDSIQFPLRLKNNINDVKITIFSPKANILEKNKKFNYIITCENTGSKTVDGFVDLNVRKWFKNIVSEPEGNLINQTTYRWNYSQLAVGKKAIFFFSALADNVDVEDSISFQAQAVASITSGANNYPEDDKDSLSQQFSYSLKQFYKGITPAPLNNDSISYISSNTKEIRYDISAYNFSTDTVYSVIIIDSLDLNLDISYIQETGSNLNYTTEIYSDPSNQYKGIIVWRFNQANLHPNPNKNIEITKSNVYIGFKIQLINNTQGALIKNTATIYFDNDYLGKTNSVFCQIAPNVTVNNNSLLTQLMVYPNPFENTLKINSESKVLDIVIYDLTGKKIETEFTNINEINTENLTSGIYFLNITTEKGIEIFKVVKE